MKKIGEFITPIGYLQLSTPDWDMPLLTGIKIKPGRWEIYIDGSGSVTQVLLKAKFQEPHLPENNGGSYFAGGKL